MLFAQHEEQVLAAIWRGIRRERRRGHCSRSAANKNGDQDRPTLARKKTDVNHAVAYVCTNPVYNVGRTTRINASTVWSAGKGTGVQAERADDDARGEADHDPILGHAAHRYDPRTRRSADAAAASCA